MLPAPTKKQIIYKCSYTSCHYSQYSDDPSAVCTCSRKMTTVLQYVAPPSTGVQHYKLATYHEGGFVKGVVTYMIMDDLEVKPMSTISSLTLLNKFNVKQVGALQEKVVELGREEAVKLLKTSLISKKVLTEVFLNTS